MNLNLLTPEVFDAIIIVNIMVGAALAWRRFRRDISAPLPDDAPPSARERFDSSPAEVPPEQS
ncbi:MAG: hypothetical protein OXG85_04580 [Chloroflexi bacterium]|nr:hypothetical protein [Chloroflexota bacterium]